MKTLWFYLHFPDLFLNSLHQPRVRPLAILSPSELRIEQFNAEAKCAGLQQGMSLSTALSLCPELQTEPMDEVKEAQLLEQKALWAYQFSAQISLDRPEGFWMEVSSMLKLFGGIAQLWRHILQSHPTAYGLQLGCAYIPLQAKLLAVSAQGQPTADPAVALKSISQLAIECLDLKPSQKIQQQSGLNPALSRRRRLSGRGSKRSSPCVQTTKLARVGAKTLGDLLKLPAAGIATRYGQSLMLQIQQLKGQQVPAMHWFQPPLKFSQTAHFIEDVEHLNGLIFPLKPLLAALAALLQQRQLGTRRLQLALSHRHRATSIWKLSFASPVSDYDELVTLTRYQLEKRQLLEPATELELRVDLFEEKSGQQDECWPETRPALANSVALDSLLNRLQARLDRQQVLRLELNFDARPEQAGRLISASLGTSDSVNLASGHSSLQAKQEPPHRQRLLAHRPLWLLAPPRPWTTPDKSSLTKACPQRIVSGWWDNQGIKRDYYQIWFHGQLLWVFRDTDSNWFLHGWFG